MEFITQPLVLIFVIATMLSVGLMLSPRDIAAALRNKRWLIQALLANFVLLPALAFSIARLLQLDTPLSAALLILATAPGGPVLIKLAGLSKGDPALAVGLLVTLSLLAVFTQPILLPMLLVDVQISTTAIIFTLLTTVLAPLLAGLGLRAVRADWAATLQLPVQRLSTLSMILVCTVLPAQHWQALVGLASGQAFPAACAFILLAALGGWLLGGPQGSSRRMLALNCCQPNLAVAVVIASHNFADPKVVLMLLVIMLCSVLILLPLCFYFARQNTQTVNIAD